MGGGFNPQVSEFLDFLAFKIGYNRLSLPFREH
jgi:hypothetical protein